MEACTSPVCSTFQHKHIIVSQEPSIALCLNEKSFHSSIYPQQMHYSSINSFLQTKWMKCAFACQSYTWTLPVAGLVPIHNAAVNVLRKIVIKANCKISRRITLVHIFFLQMLQKPDHNKLNNAKFQNSRPLLYTHPEWNQVREKVHRDIAEPISLTIEFLPW
jgi:hypothetical protein